MSAMSAPVDASTPDSNAENADVAGEPRAEAVSSSGVNAAPAQVRPRNRIQVSREKRPLNFFVGLAKKFLVNEDEVEVSGLGLAVTTVVTVVEILRNSGHVEITRISTSLVDTAGEGRGGVPKAKIQIWIRKGPKFPSADGSDGQPATASTPSIDPTPSPAPSLLASTAVDAPEASLPTTERSSYVPNGTKPMSSGVEES